MRKPGCRTIFFCFRRGSCRRRSTCLTPTWPTMSSTCASCWTQTRGLKTALARLARSAFRMIPSCSRLRSSAAAPIGRQSRSSTFRATQCSRTRSTGSNSAQSLGRKVPRRARTIRKRNKRRSASTTRAFLPCCRARMTPMPTPTPTPTAMLTPGAARKQPLWSCIRCTFTNWDLRRKVIGWYFLTNRRQRCSMAAAPRAMGGFCTCRCRRVARQRTCCGSSTCGARSGANASTPRAL
mmetsp:Transcript_1420/g.3825  ORF Transcript_1420/g.3825 Transcript_1420/m.3825 type:complete len:238 (-) Transcript_1420:2088-2801(-)